MIHYMLGVRFLTADVHFMIGPVLIVSDHAELLIKFLGFLMKRNAIISKTPS